MQMCASGLNKTYFETVKTTAVYCRYLCPAPVGVFVKEEFVRYWSNLSQWPEGRLHLPGEDVYVHGNWTIIMDIDPAECGLMSIDGDVVIEDKFDRNISCQAIWVKAGSITAGSASEPFTHQLTIQLNGQKNDPGYTFDPALQGNKIMVVTGNLNLFGSGPSTVSTRLLESVSAGDTQMTVESVTGWAVNDTIVMAPSFNSAKQHERVQIVSISGTIVTFDPALSYSHYGAANVTISNSIG